MASTINSDNGVVSGSVGLKYASDNSGVLALQTNGNTAITVGSTGYVGVGTTSPNYLLHAASNYAGLGKFERTGTTTGSAQVSFVNGINTSRGGKHIDYITGQITKRLSEMVASKTKKEVKPQHIKDNLAIFVKCLIVNPSFDTQTKDALTTPSAKFGSKCELSDKFMTALYKSGLADKAISLTEFHQEKKVAKTDGKKTNRIIVPKLDDANLAGTRHSQECTLILTEGDSAKTMAIAGLSVVGRDRYGVFPDRKSTRLNSSHT